LSEKKIDYGIDAPTVVRNLFIAAAISTIIYLISVFSTLSIAESCIFRWICGLVGLGSLANATYMIWSSKVGKLHQRDLIVKKLQLTGGEHVLDLGCGRGLLLIGVAKLLKDGKAIGIDNWQNVDLSENSAAATLDNARLEGVLDRVEIVTGDIRKLPFPDESFDHIISSLVIHNIYDVTGRSEALKEVFRVLKKGGKILIQDIRHGKEYMSVMNKLCANNIDLSRPSFNIYGAQLLYAEKPGVC